MMHLIHTFLDAEETYAEDADPYTEDGLDACADDDEISAEEAGFMHGYLWL